MRQLCPSCSKVVDLPAEAEQTTCPHCRAVVTAPPTYSIAVDPAAVAPAAPALPAVPAVSAVPPAPGNTATPIVNPNQPPPPPGYALPTPPSVSRGYSNSCAMGLSAGAIPWIAAGALLLILILTPFPWAGAYPGGSTAYSQSYWGALTSSFSSTIPFEQELKQESAIRKVIGWDWWLLLPYLVVVLAATTLALADRLVTAPDFAFRIGPMGTLRALVWPRRQMILAGLAVLALLLFGLHALRGFNLHNGVKAVAAAKLSEELAAVDNSADRERVRAKISIEEAKFGLGMGTAWWLVGLAHLVAAGATGLHLWLESRGQSPPPRLVAEW